MAQNVKEPAGGAALPRPAAPKPTAPAAPVSAAAKPREAASPARVEAVTVTGQDPGVRPEKVKARIDKAFAQDLVIRAMQGTEATRVATATATPLAKNAIVRSFRVKVKAGPADIMPLTVAQARASELR